MTARQAFHVARVLFLQVMGPEEGQAFDLTLEGALPEEEAGAGRIARVSALGGDVVVD